MLSRRAATRQPRLLHRKCLLLPMETYMYIGFIVKRWVSCVYSGLAFRCTLCLHTPVDWLFRWRVASVENDELHIQVNDGHIGEYTRLLSPAEQQRVRESGDAAVQQQRILARAFVRSTLSRYLPRTEPQQVRHLYPFVQHCFGSYYSWLAQAVQDISCQ